MLAMVILPGQNECTRPGVSMTVVFAVGSGVVILIILIHFGHSMIS